jgi:hypothetical protein
MQRELVPSETLAQYIQNPLGILEIRERHHGVVGEPDKGTFPLATPASSGLPRAGQTSSSGTGATMIFHLYGQTCRSYSSTRCGPDTRQHTSRVRPSCAWRTSWLSSRPTRIVITGTPSDLSHILKLEKPVVRARYEFAEVGEPSLSGLIDEVLRRRGVLAAPPNH